MCLCVSMCAGSSRPGKYGTRALHASVLDVERLRFQALVLQLPYRRSPALFPEASSSVLAIVFEETSELDPPGVLPPWTAIPSLFLDVCAYDDNYDG